MRYQAWCGGPWEMTPKWHPRRWLGYDVRRWVEDYNTGDDHWQYGRSKKVAREMLRRTYGEKEPVIGQIKIKMEVWNGREWMERL